MAFTDTGTVDELNLRDRISITNDQGYWITGKVVELALLGDDETDVRITLRNVQGTFTLDRAPESMFIYEWEDKETS